MRQLLKTLECHSDYDGHSEDLVVIEYIEGTGRYEDGYLCENIEGDEFFVALTGDVEKRTVHSWYVWGTCPALENEYKLFEQLST